MNTALAQMNLWAEQLVSTAWPMFWQSSVLIAFLLALDLVLRKQLRASVRYALWLVLLLKLVLPPTLALPTGVGWWVRQRSAVAVKFEPSPGSFAVRYGPAMSPLAEPKGDPTIDSLNHEVLTRSAWMLLFSGSVSLGLFAWMLIRWRRVMLTARPLLIVPEGLNELFAETRRSTGFRGRVRLRIVDRAMSPAVCGLFRPTLVVPQTLVERLSGEQMRSILLHELIHLKRGDVWVNCAQALLQIAYWWHPRLWVANARIRRVREEAVDDAVMAALQGQADAYAPTLVEVAKLAPGRLITTLGLVGILESRGALRQRIERLLEFRSPRRAGLSLASVLCVSGFAAMALPMGPAPGQATTLLEEADSVGVTTLPNFNTLHTRVFKVDPTTFTEKLRSVIWVAPGNTNSTFLSLKEFFASLGLDLNPPKTLFYKDRQGMLVVKATLADLDTIEHAISELNRAPPQIHVKVKFVELPVKLSKLFWEGRTNGVTRVGILTEPQARVALKALESQVGAKIVNEASVTTLSGRQTQIEWAEEQSVSAMTNVALKNASSQASNFVTNQVPIGSKVDIYPFVGADGYTVQLTVSASTTEFLGYDDPGLIVQQLGLLSLPITAPLPLPHFRVLQLPTKSANVWDGQTLVLGRSDQVDTNQVPVFGGDRPLAGRLFRSEPKDKDFIIFLTPTIIDPAGNRVHSDDEIPGPDPKSK